MHACAVGSTCAAPLNGRWSGALRCRSIDSCVGCGYVLGSQASVRRLECESAWVALLALLYREESAVDDAWLFIRLLQESADGSAARAVLLKALAGACRARPGQARPGQARPVPFPVRLKADRQRLPPAAPAAVGRSVGRTAPQPSACALAVRLAAVPFGFGFALAHSAIAPSGGQCSAFGAAEGCDGGKLV